MKNFTLSLLLFFSLSCGAQVPFSKGVNLTNWFQASSARQIQFSKYTRKDFERIKSLGCDVVRLPINLHAMTNGEPHYILDPLFLEFLDQAVTWAEDIQLHLILDNHSFDPAANTDPEVADVLVKVWTQMATHYASRSTSIYYEVLNEPHGIADDLWGSIQQDVIDAIRGVDGDHYIIVGPAGWNSYNNLAALPLYTDAKLIYTFHFYDPFMFTHQGASWVDPSMVPVAGVPFPYQSAGMPATPNVLKGTWVESSLNNYVNDGTVTKVKSLIDIATLFKNDRQVPLYCGEFGVYIPNSDNDDRVYWYDVIRNYLEQNDIAWTSWDYQGGFGLFEKNSDELFDYDLNAPLLQALGMNVPPQETPVKRPRTSGFLIYDDYIGEGIVDASYIASGVLDFYNEESPFEGSKHIFWTGVQQYSSIAFDFKPNADLSLLKEHDHVLEFWVKGNTPGGKFDVRFIDTKTGASDHPWRMGKTIDNTFAPWDGQWHKVTVALKTLEEKGSYDDAWFDPDNKFDWTSIDRFEIVAEHQALTNVEFGFDAIRISGEDVVIEEPVTGIEEMQEFHFQVAPNPMDNQTTIQFFLSRSGPVNLSIHTITGQRVRTLANESLNPGEYKFKWEGLNNNGQRSSSGIYIVQLRTPGGILVKKLIKR